jgi:hypothetical protein
MTFIKGIASKYFCVKLLIGAFYQKSIDKIHRAKNYL